MTDKYMSARSFEKNKRRFGTRQFTITELYNGFHCFVYKDYRRVFLTDMSGKRLPQIPELVPDLRFLRAPQLKLDCQLIPSDTTLLGQDRKVASRELAKAPSKSVDDFILIANDLPTFADKPYPYRRAMMEFYLRSCTLVQPNPVLTSSFDIEDVELWAEWARQNHKDGIQIIFNDYPYLYTETSNLLYYRTN